MSKLEIVDPEIYRVIKAEVERGSINWSSSPENYVSGDLKP
jgi:hypothetical protein